MSSMSYSYSPRKLLASYSSLKKKEEELLERGSSAHDDADSSDSPMWQNSDNGNNLLVVAATQITGAGLPDSDVAGFCFRAEQAIEMAVKLSHGNNNTGGSANVVVLLPELWSGPYFCQSQESDLFQLSVETTTTTTANEVEISSINSSSVLIQRMQSLAKLYSVVLPVSIYERCNNCFYNSVVTIDADGSILGTYRKSHIPDGAGYQEKFYFTPGDTGFKVFDTCKGGFRIGVAICWDQWFPECARAMALQGADVLLYPSAIGSEPGNISNSTAPLDYSADHWQRVMQGHAAANMIPVVASNRFGTEILLEDDGVTEKQRITFYGRSFITDNKGAVIAQCADNTEETVVTVVTATVDPESNRRSRAAWGLFRDRRPDLYRVIRQDTDMM